jgi:Sec-independent protein translocase protein TatA
MLLCVDSGPTNTEPEVFALMMMTYVYNADITYPALLSGCMAIEEAKKPVRSIGYVLEILRQHQGEWCDRQVAIRSIGSTIVELRDAILQAQQKLKREQAVIAVRDAEHELQHRRNRLERLRKEEKDKVDARCQAKRDYEDACENLETAVAKREAAERAIPDAELALQSAQAALVRLQADGGGTNTVRGPDTGVKNANQHHGEYELLEYWP